MQLLPHENTIAKHESTILTDKAVIQEKKSWIGNSNYTEIPINRVDSISRNYISRISFLVLTFLFAVLGFYFYNQGQNTEMIFILLIISVVSLFLYVLTATKELIIKSGNETILENAKGADKFVSKLRKQMYLKK